MEEKKPTKEDTARVKGLGCLRDKRYDDVFNVRVITGYGKLDAAKMRALSDAAERFGTGEVALTTRQTVEIQGVKYEKLDELFKFLDENGLSTGGTGAKVRPVVSCKGTTCVYGLVDTYSLAKKISEKFYFEMHGAALPHKFKIAVGGCPNNCVKPQLNDLGVVGTRRPALDTEKCRGCKVCQVESACPVGAAVKIDDRITIDREKCLMCGRCTKSTPNSVGAKCPFGAVTPEITGYRVFIGGRWGKGYRIAKPLPAILTSEDEVIRVITKVIDVYKANGNKGERFADTVERVGFDKISYEILGK